MESVQNPVSACLHKALAGRETRRSLSRSGTEYLNTPHQSEKFSQNLGAEDELASPSLYHP